MVTATAGGYCRRSSIAASHSADQRCAMPLAAGADSAMPARKLHTIMNCRHTRSRRTGAGRQAGRAGGKRGQQRRAKPDECPTTLQALLQPINSRIPGQPSANTGLDMPERQQHGHAKPLMPPQPGSSLSFHRNPAAWRGFRSVRGALYVRQQHSLEPSSILRTACSRQFDARSRARRRLSCKPCAD